MKRIYITLIVSTIILSCIVGVVIAFSPLRSETLPTESNIATPTPNDASPVPVLAASPTPESTVTSETANAQLLAAVSEYYETPISPEAITASSKSHAQGEYGNEWWLACKTDSETWEVVASGCSYINCAEIKNYDFPIDMVPVCWDNTKNDLLFRSE